MNEEMKMPDSKMEKKKQVEYIGYGEVAKIRDIVKEYQPGSVFLVTGKSSYNNSPAAEVINSVNGVKFTHFTDFTVNPKIEDIKKGIELYEENNCDLCVAIGGGSVIDIAKAINILQVQDGQIEDYVTSKEKVEKPGKPLVAVPTTAGTGSEATSFAVVYIDKTKYSLAADNILPDVAIVDPDLEQELPARITAETGMDAFCQGVESYWSNNSTDESKEYARQAIELAFNNIDAAVNGPDKESRLAMAKAANFSGKGINISKTTASHAVSYPITSHFNVAHGHAVALTIGSMLVYNSQVTEEDINDGRGVEYVKQTTAEIAEMLGVENTADAKVVIEGLMQKIGLETKLSELGITEDDLDLIIANGFNPQRVKNNPRILTEEGLRKILKNLL